jgi:uncharacterized protein (DUF1778 family)
MHHRCREHLFRGPLVLYGQCVYSRGLAKIKERWDFRVDPETDRLVRHAAQTAERTLTDFVVDAAVVEAERLLADRTEFILDAEHWERFVDLLDRSPQDNPGLAKLFAKPSVLSGS